MLTTGHSLARCVAKAVVFQPLAAVVDNVLGFLVDGGVDVDVNGNVSWGFNLCVSDDGFIDGLLFALRKVDRLDCRGFGAVESSDLSFTAIALTILAVSNKVAFLTITWRFGRGRYRAYSTNWNFTSNATVLDPCSSTLCAVYHCPKKLCLLELHVIICTHTHVV